MDIFLHCCCAPCATWCIERLINEKHNITLFYDNPNIYPESERLKRLDNLEKLAAIHSLDLVVGNTSHSQWLEYIRGYEDEPEHGKRCKKCFEFTLSLTQTAMQKEVQKRGKDFSGLTTTLSVSRYKDTQAIFKASEVLSETFLKFNFKENGGDAASNRLSKELGLYRQKYCGCEFSLNY